MTHTEPVSQLTPRIHAMYLLITWNQKQRPQRRVAQQHTVARQTRCQKARHFRKQGLTQRLVNIPACAETGMHWFKIKTGCFIITWRRVCQIAEQHLVDRKMLCETAHAKSKGSRRFTNTPVGAATCIPCSKNKSRAFHHHLTSSALISMANH